MPDSLKLVAYRRPRDRNLDLTPLLDVIFQLLIFFMVSSQFVSPMSKIDLPVGAGGVKPEDATTIRVEVASSGEIRVEDEVIVDADFESKVKAAMDARGIDKVQFHGDKTLDYGDVVGLMVRALAVGVQGFEIVTNPRTETEEL